MSNKLIKDIINDETLTPEEKINAINDHLTQDVEEGNYAESYKELLGVVGSLEKMSGPDVDAIIPLMEKGMKAFKSCEERINNIEKCSLEMQ